MTSERWTAFASAVMISGRPYRRREGSAAEALAAHYRRPFRYLATHGGIDEPSDLLDPRYTHLPLYSAEDAMDYPAIFAAITSDPHYQRNLDWGEPRPGHPEGTVRPLPDRRRLHRG